MIIKPINITKENFLEFGDLISSKNVNPIDINDGYANRFDDLAKIKNADIGEILGYSNKGLRLSACIKLMKHYGRDWKRLLDGFVNRKKLPPPLVIRDKDNNLWVLCTGGISEELPVLYKINPLTLAVDDSFVFDDITHSPTHLAVNSAGDILYFLNMLIARFTSV